jgi:glycosyltransferase involved in cell wall biosynthesis
MGSRFPASTARSGGSGRPALPVEVVIPVYNESAVLRDTVTRLHRHLAEHHLASWQITIADNASTDDSWPVAMQLAVELPGVRAVHLDPKGRGRALKEVWLHSQARVVAYMDADLSTDLAALLPLVAPLLAGECDLAIGSRLIAGARVRRGLKREAISRGYNRLLRLTLHSRVSDAQCGFKAARSEAARALLPLVESDGWFFDTELLMLAQRNGLGIHEVPVDWVDDPDSRVAIGRTIVEDVRGIWRLRRAFAAGKGLLPVATSSRPPSDPPGPPTGSEWEPSDLEPSDGALSPTLNSLERTDLDSRAV